MLTSVDEMLSDTARTGESNTFEDLPPVSQLNVTAKKRNESWADFAFIAVLTLVICAIFAKTIFLGEPLSKVARITFWDTAFKSMRAGSSGLMDPSLLQLMVPYYLTVAKMWHAGQFPLWNMNNACGVPLLADPQSEVLSPLHAVLALNPNLRTYNLTIVFELWLGAMGTFMLGRCLGLTRLAALLAATSFAFCPFLDWFLELIGNGYMFYPLVFFLFARAAQRPTLARAAGAGMGTACMILSGHPEVTFFGAVFGAMLNVLLIATNTYQSAGDGFSTLLARIALAFRQVAFAAAIAFCLCAPLLVPFAEYMANAQSYKLATKTVESIPALNLVLNLFQPTLGGASLYLGFLPLVCMPFCLCIRDSFLRKSAITIAAIALISESFTAQLFPLNLLSCSLIIPNYCQPVPLLGLALLGGFGFDALIRNGNSALNKTRQSVVAVAFIVLFVPFLLRITNIPLASLAFDTSLSLPKLGTHAWQNIAICGSITTLLLLLSSYKRLSKARTLMLVACIGVSLFTQLMQVKSALPTQGKFEYLAVPSTSALTQAEGRFIATGEHLMRPNTNVLYNISDLRFHNPIFPQRFRTFMQACGARLDGFNETFGGPLKSTISLASVNSVLALEPAWSFEDFDRLKCEPLERLATWGDAAVDAVVWRYDSNNKQVIFKLHWTTTPVFDRTTTCSLAIMNDAGNLIWFSDQHRISQRDKKTKQQLSSFEQQLGVPIRDEWRNENLHVGIRILDNRSGKFARVQRPDLTDHPADSVATLFSMKPADCPPESQTTDSRLRLDKEIKGGIRLYRNIQALPNAYMVKHIRIARDAQESLATLMAPEFKQLSEAVVEADTEADHNLMAAELAPFSTEPSEALIASEPDSVRVGRPNGNAVEIECRSEENKFLVLTDTWFPGWKAYVDDKPVKVWRTNYMFRGIVVPAGTHSIKFRYEPVSLLLGLGFFAIGLALLLITLAASLYFRRDRGKPFTPASGNSQSSQIQSE